MKSKELSDKQWKIMQKHLPKPAGTGRPRADDRTTINGILYVLTTGCRWEEMPKRYGSKSTAHRRLQGWQQKGIWNRIVNSATRQAYTSGRLSIKSTAADSTDIPSKKGETGQGMMDIRGF